MTHQLESVTSALSLEEYVWTGDIEPRIAEIWDTLATAGAQAPLFRYRAWSEFLCREGMIAPWKIVLIFDRGRPIALFPLCRTRPWCVRVVDEFAEYDAPFLIADGAEEAAMRVLARWFRRQSPLSFLSLGLCADQRALQQIHAVFTDGGVTPAPQALLPVAKLPLPESWDAYLAGLSAGARGKIKKLEPTLLRDYPAAKIEWITAASSERARDEALEALMRLHQQRWREFWSGSVFEKERTRRFFRAMMHWAFSRDATVLILIRLQDRIVAAASLLHVPGQQTGYCHYLARDEQALPARYSTGKILVCQSVRWAMQRKARELNLSATSIEYKKQLGGIVSEQYELLFARAAGLSKLPRTLDFFYEILTNPLAQSLRHISYKLQEQRISAQQGEAQHAEQR